MSACLDYSTIVYARSMDTTITQADMLIHDYLAEQIATRNLTQKDIQEFLGGRSKGYVSDRILGRRSWDISELDVIARQFGMNSAIELIIAVDKWRKLRDAQARAQASVLERSLSEHARQRDYMQVANRDNHTQEIVDD